MPPGNSFCAAILINGITATHDKKRPTFNIENFATHKMEYVRTNLIHAGKTSNHDNTVALSDRLSFIKTESDIIGMCKAVILGSKNNNAFPPAFSYGSKWRILIIESLKVIDPYEDKKLSRLNVYK